MTGYPEQRLAQAIMGQDKASVLMTDGYKFSMAQAGFPLREETFVLCFRRGQPLYNPFDLADVVQAFIPGPPSAKESAFLTANGYGMTPAMGDALTMPIRVVAASKGTWIAPGTPALTVTGPSFLVSWLEPFLIMLNYPLQIATAARKGERDFQVVCSDEEKILRIVEEVYNPPGMAEVYPDGIRTAFDFDQTKTTLNADGEEQYVAYDHEAAKFNVVESSFDYIVEVENNVQAVVIALKRDAQRAFEVGLRAATCMQQHLMVLEMCHPHGVMKTSNVYGAWRYYMIPVGTTGHEHQMRWGGPRADDKHGYRAIRDMRPEPPSYLFDTTDPMNRGIPAALEVMLEDPTRPCSMRFDSGDQDAQFRKIHAGIKKFNLEPNLIFEDGYTADKTVKNEAFCDAEGWPIQKRMYGYGGFLVSKPHPSPYNRDVVSAAYKLSCTAGQAVMKRSGSPGKESIPGKPIVLQVKSEEKMETVVYVIAQEGEDLGEWGPPEPLSFIPDKITVLKSEKTCDLIHNSLNGIG
jgi:nicotinate phosphoribosyltransferase